MSAFEDMRLLKEEEKLIKELLSRLKNQLNRLKVEELELKAKGRQKQIESTKQGVMVNVATSSEAKQVENDNINALPLDLNLRQADLYNDDRSNGMSSVEEDEDEAEDDECQNDQEAEFREHQEQLNYFMTDMG